MIFRNGVAATLLVTFSTGHPDGDVTWQALGADGAVLSFGTIAPAADAVSTLIPLDPATNTLAAGEYTSWRDVTWTYEVDGAIVNGEYRYTIEARLPLGLSVDGVRNKLGLSREELPDEEIPLVNAFLSFVNTVTEPIFTAAQDGGINDLTLRRAIEASAALRILATMPVRVPISESSGTNTFKRDSVDWEAVRDDLQSMVDDGFRIIDPLFDPTVGFGSLLLLASPAVDPITGA